MKRSRIFSLLLAAALLCGCGAKKTETVSPSPTAPSEKTETISLPRTTAVPEPTAEQIEGGEGAEALTQGPSLEEQGFIDFGDFYHQIEE